MRGLQLSFVLLASALSAVDCRRTPAQNVLKPTPSHDAAQLPDLETHRHQRYSAFVNALKVMQDRFFSSTYGTWPDAIDWTATVLNTHIGSSVETILDWTFMEAREVLLENENLINRYFDDMITFYFGEDSFSLRMQAYDDMLWVVLDWLQAVKFIGEYVTRREQQNLSAWHGAHFIPQFAQRARMFYDLASNGWDETLCGGGMVWTRYGRPYKNAITNELFITASINMYHFYTGDTASSPVGAADEFDRDQYLEIAIKAYDWLKGSNMVNYQGLYIDGYHVTGWRGGDHPSNGTGQCDHSNRKTYTYNQGVILSGLRGLWKATGNVQYLRDGHALIEKVVAATGWEARDGPLAWQWAGMGRNGTLEEACDWSGQCNQNGQTFKGIFFHHFSLFCKRILPEEEDADGNVCSWHADQCASYALWVYRNADAAAVTQDDNKEVGMWWGRPAETADAEITKAGDTKHAPSDCDGATEDADGDCVDYRNNGVPRDDIWTLDYALEPQHRTEAEPHQPELKTRRATVPSDLNDRGRGRTVESQSGGLAVFEAAWVLLNSYGHNGLESSSST